MDHAQIIPILRRFDRPSSEIPDEVWDAMDRARARGEELAGRGEAIRFVAPVREGGRVRVELRDRSDRVLRELDLGDITSL